MRKLSIIAAISAGFLLIQSCSKKAATDAVAPVNPSVINATVALNGSYQLPIVNSGIVSISKQASHFMVSETGQDSKSGLMVYKYIPALDFVGSDEVVLSNIKTSIVTGSGCSNNHTSNSEAAVTSTSYTIIKLNITN